MIEDWSLWQNLDVLANNIFAVHKLMQQKIFRYILNVFQNRQKILLFFFIGICMHIIDFELIF